MSIVFDVKTQTKSADVSYTVELASQRSFDFFDCTDILKFSDLCKNGCINYEKKWSCPPYAPSFEEFSKGFENLLILYMRIDLNQFSYIKNDYLKIKAGNSILKSRADKFLRTIVSKDSKFISTGSCRLCKSCKCKTNKSCAYPNKMTYSFEALGINVDKVVNQCFESPLLWYKTGALPKYTSVVCGLLTNELISVEFLRDEYMNHIST